MYDINVLSSNEATLTYTLLMATFFRPYESRILNQIRTLLLQDLV